MQADEAAIESALQRHIAKESETLGGLHDAIDPAQRRATVASVRAKEPAMPEEQARMGYGGGPQDVAKRKLDLMTSDLGLDEAQQQQVAKWVSEQSGSMRPMYEERRKRRDALFDAFESSTFNANALAPSSLGAEVRMHLDEHVAFLSKLVPILRTEQREKLASMIEGRGLGGDHDQD